MRLKPRQRRNSSDNAMYFDNRRASWIADWCDQFGHRHRRAFAEANQAIQHETEQTRKALTRRAICAARVCFRCKRIRELCAHCLVPHRAQASHK